MVPESDLTVARRMNVAIGDLRIGANTFWAVMVSALAIVSILPFWIFHRFPAGDNLNHLYSVYVIADLLTNPHSVFSRYLELHMFAGGNFLYYAALLPFASSGASLVTAERVLFTINTALIFASFVYAIPSRRSLPIACCVPILAFSYPFYLGLANFWLSLPPFLFLLGYYRRHRDAWTWRNTGVLALFCLWMFSAHGLVLMISSCFVVASAIEEYTTTRRPGFLVHGAAQIACTGFFALLFCISIARLPPPVNDFVPVSALAHIRMFFHDVSNGSCFASFTPLQSWLCRLFVVLWLVLLIGSVRTIHQQRMAVPLSAAIFVTLALAILPQSKAGWQGLVMPRFALVFFLLSIVLFANIAQAPTAIRVFGIGSALLSIAFLYTNWKAFDVIDRILTDQARISERIPQGATLLALDTSSSPPTPFNLAPWAFKVPVGHTGGEIALRSRAVLLNNYEANVPFFFIQFKKDLDPYRLLSVNKHNQGGWLGIDDNPPRISPSHYRHASRGCVEYIWIWNEQRQPPSAVAPSLGKELASGFQEIYSTGNDRGRLYRAGQSCEAR